MSVELFAIGCLFVFSVLASVYSAITYKRDRAAFMELIPVMKEEIHEEVQGAIDAFGDALTGIMTEPTVKKAMSIIGKQGGDAKAARGLVDEMAIDVLDSPQFSLVKMGAESMLGVDIDKYIEKNGAVKTLAAARQLASALGVNFDGMIAQGLAGMGSLSQPGLNPGSNYYLGGH